MSDDSPSPLQAEMQRIAPKIEAAAQAKTTKTKGKREPEFKLADTLPPDVAVAVAEAKAFTAEIRHMTTKDARALISLKRSPKPHIHYSQEIANTILSLMAEGMMLVEICEREDMPSMVAVWQWRMKFPDFDLKLSRAREALGDQFAWEVRRVADDSNALTAPADRIKMDAYRWLAAKMYPKQYGDKTVTELTGTVVHEQRHVIDATQLSSDQVDALEGVLRAAQALPAPPQSED